MFSVQGARATTRAGSFSSPSALIVPNTAAAPAMSEVISAANSSIRGATPSASPATSFSPLDTPGLIFKVLSLSVVRDWMLVFVIGIALEFLRRSLSYYWQKAKNFFWIRVTLDEGDDCGSE